MVRDTGIVGAILAGGASTRMGRDKALVPVAGRPMVEWVAEALAPVCAEVIVVGRAEPVAGLRAVPDPGLPHRGPLSGLVAAFQASGGRPVLLVATDQPWVRTTTLRHLAERVGDLAAVPVVDGVRQTTCAAYPAALSHLAADELDGDGSIQTVLDVAAFDPVTDREWRAWGEDGRSFFGADDPEAIEEGLRRWGPPGQPPM